MAADDVGGEGTCGGGGGEGEGEAKSVAAAIDV
jgi:hypothetical protein